MQRLSFGDSVGLVLAQNVGFRSLVTESVFAHIFFSFISSVIFLCRVDSLPRVFWFWDCQYRPKLIVSMIRINLILDTSHIESIPS